jgi:hypothetical protein
MSHDIAEKCRAVVGSERFEVLRLAADLWLEDVQADGREPIACLDVPELAMAIKAARIRDAAGYDAAREYLNDIARILFLEPAHAETVAQNHDVKTSKPGYVYVLTNPSLIGLVKIGMTTATVEHRVKQLSRSTSIPTSFEVLASFASDNPSADEQKIHALLKQSRVPSSEFFRVSIKQAIEVCASVLGGAV